MAKTKELWCPVVGYEGYYEVSNHGRVRSLRRIVPLYRDVLQVKRGTVLFPTTTTGQRAGYKSVGLSRNGKRKTFMVHTLVATAFLYKPRGKREVNHIDRDKANNLLENLEWLTHLQNIRHARRTGWRVTPLYGEANPGSKLTNAQRINIADRANNERRQALADEFGVCIETVRKIILFRARYEPAQKKSEMLA